jgi:predicted HTH transcriptional regulator
MAQVIRRAFDVLVEGEVVELATWPPSAAAVEHLVQTGEGSSFELKSSMRSDTLDKGIPPQVIEKVVARTIAGFMNSHGGTLVIGVRDDGTPLGLDKDIATLPRKDIDGFQQALVQVIAKYLGADVAAMVRICIVRIGPETRDVAVVECPAAGTPVYLKDGDTKEFHVRAGATTRLLDIEETATYVGHHWKHAAAAAPALAGVG